MNEHASPELNQEFTEPPDSEGGLLFYRCYLCRNVISKWDIESQGFTSCPKCGHSKLSPSNLTAWEKTVQIWKHPAVWKWDAAFKVEPADG